MIWAVVCLVTHAPRRTRAAAEACGCKYAGNGREGRPLREWPSTFGSMYGICGRHVVGYYSKSRPDKREHNNQRTARMHKNSPREPELIS
ncbi:hypothetical protein BCR44DRAFT_1100386 [Catenaria anguillulae PL171]|uniref:Uncharacterized protein n=1 Tax=Catenaria anguillulae PL171 TaxID=765915 RepID=A0A1Y2I1N8_9FUNG|nr:hypothetical protein BCR44DRAFT_1100386 [Catenaria anguillulae PL171]